MNFKNILERLERFPVGIIGTIVGAITLSNGYSLIGLSFLRNIFMPIGIVVFILATIKIIHHHKTFLNEYKTPVAGSLYATYSMLLVLIGSYIFQFAPTLGKSICFLGFALHIIFILFFTYLHLHKNFKIETFLPCWFATYIGILVLSVVGVPFNIPTLGKILAVYGMIIYIIILPFLIWRIIKFAVEHKIIHTLTVFLAPPSMCLVSYLNFYNNPNIILIFVLYICLILSLIYILSNFGKFFAQEFHPGFGGLTFPLAISTVASLKVYKFFESQNYIHTSNIIFSIAQMQIFITTAVIGMVLYNFSKKIFPNKKS